MASFHLPEELQRLVNEFARPCTRPDWRRGCALVRAREQIGEFEPFIYELWRLGLSSYDHSEHDIQYSEDELAEY